MTDIKDEIGLFTSLLQQQGDIFDQARCMKELCMRYHYTQSSLARKLGVSQSCVGNKLRLLQFSAREQSQILNLGLTERHARALLRAKSPQREKLIATAGNMHLTVQQTEELVEKYTDHTEHTVSDCVGIDSTMNSDSYLTQVQRGAERLRALGYRTTCLTESGEGWTRISVTIVG